MGEVGFPGSSGRRTEEDGVLPAGCGCVWRAHASALPVGPALGAAATEEARLVSESPT